MLRTTPRYDPRTDQTTNHNRTGASLNVLGWEEVTAIFNEKHGTSLTRNRIWQIAMQAEAKIKRALKSA
jgi:hypothetical protein